MSNLVTLDSIRAAAEQKYGSYDIALSETETVRLRNPLKMTKTERESMQSFQEALSAEDADQELILSDLIRLVADSKPKADKLLKAIGHDLTVIATIFAEYSEKVSPGEASASQG